MMDLSAAHHSRFHHQVKGGLDAKHAGIAARKLTNRRKY